jgi:RNA polymerase sigma factor (sigma-70 family)
MDLSKYYEHICKVPLLTKEEEQDLFLELQDQEITAARREEVRTRIISANLRFPFKRAKVYSRNDPAAFEELILAGNEGLVVGFEKFHPEAGVRFLSYAGWWVDQRILKQMSSRVVAVPVWKQQLSAKIQRIVDRDPHIRLDDLKKQLPPDSKPKYVEELFNKRYLTYYIEDLDSEPEFEVDPIQNEVNLRLDQEKIHAAVDTLTSPHKELIQMTFGMYPGHEGEMKPKDIALALKLSKEEMKNVKAQALEQLRVSLGAHDFGCV